jgi:antitoxin HicB
MDYAFWADIRPDPDGGYLVTFPDVPEAITQGGDMADALRSAAEALGLALRGYLADGEPLPQPRTTGSGLVEIPVDAADAMKLAVIEAFQASGISKSELARRLGKGENEARRILNPDHPTGLGTLASALEALGKRVVVSIKDAA